MKRLVITPKGWKCRLGELRGGMFMFDGALCLATPYNEHYVIENGDAFWGGTNNKVDRAELMVQPVTAKWEEA